MKYFVTITETQTKDIVIEADCEYDALAKIEERYNEGSIDMHDDKVEYETIFTCGKKEIRR